MAVALVLALGRAEAQVAKLNGPLARPTVGDVVDYLAAPEDGFAVLRANLDSTNLYELFVAPLDGSAPAERLHDPLPAGANIGGSTINIFGAGGQQDFRIAPGGRVLFLADIGTDGVDELYSVPADRSASPLRLNGTLAANEDVWTFQITPDGEYAVYRAQQVSGGTLFRVPTDGGAPPTPLAPGLVANWSFWLSPDGSRVVFTTPLDFGLRQELWVVPADASAAPLSLGETPPPIYFGVTGVADVVISEDNEHLACFVLYDEDGDITAHVFAARLDGTTPPPRLNVLPVVYDELAFDGDERALFREGSSLISARVDGGQRRVLTPPGWQTISPPRVAPDGSVVFPALTGSLRTLLKAPADGSTPAVELFPPVSGALNLLEIVGTHALYSLSAGGASELRSVPLAGGTPTLLNPPPFDTPIARLGAHPGGADVLFLSEGGLPGMTRLFTVPIDGSALPRLLSGSMIASGDVREFDGSAGTHVVYRADASNNESFELFGVPHAGGAALRLSPPLAPGPVLGDVDEFRITADGERVLYLADQDEDDALGLFLAHSDARGDPRRLDAGLPETTDVFDGFVTSADGRHVAFLKATSPGSANGHLYAVDLAAGGTPRLLDATTAKYEQELVLDPQTTRVFYIGRRSFQDGWDLLTARLDGSLPPDVLNLPTGAVDDFRVTPDGATVVYRSTQDTAGVLELYRVAADGSAAPQKLSTTPVAGGGVTAFELAPDGTRVVYLSDRDVDNEFELYSAPSDASTPALELSPPLVAGGDVTHFLVTPDSAFVVYRADQNDDQTFELFRVPIGGGAAVALTAALPADRAVQIDCVLAPDGQTVFFRANPAGTGRHELFRVLADGSAAAVVLSGVMVAGGSVDSFALAPDGTRLAFIADGRVDGVKELWSVPVTGNTPVLLHTMPATGDVDALRIAPDSLSVFHRADALTDAVQELFVVPLDGSGPARRLNADLPSGADVENDFVALAAGRVVFRADQEEVNVLELFMAFPGTRGALQAPTPTGTRTVIR